MTLRLALCCGATLLAGAARADLCHEIDALDTSPNPITLGLAYNDQAPVCTRSLLLGGGTQLHCGWVFPYRAAAANVAFQHLLNTVARCLGDKAHATPDPDVNHPDFYDLHTFRLGEREVGVSLKDKAARAETHIFLRIVFPR